MARLARSVATVRNAVKDQVRTLPRGATVMVACSGGPDSMALAAACAFVAPRESVHAGLITVDHGLQEGSAERARALEPWAHAAGFDFVEVATVHVDPSDGGPEAAARTQRYAAMRKAAQRRNASAVLLGHTRDDQAETVLLALARGSGPRGVSGMRWRRDLWWRPLLAVSRADTVDACEQLRLPVWHDPHNRDPAYTRSRVRAAMPVLSETLGPRLVGNLARTAHLVADDNDALDLYAETLRESAGETLGKDRLAVEPLVSAHKAVRTRALRLWAIENGARGDDLSYAHIRAVDALVMTWHGQGATALPGGVSVARVGGVLYAQAEG